MSRYEIKLHLNTTHLLELSWQTQPKAAIFQNLCETSASMKYSKETRPTYLHRDLVLSKLVRQCLHVVYQDLRVLVAVTEDVCRLEVGVGHLVFLAKANVVQYCLERFHFQFWVATRGLRQDSTYIYKRRWFALPPSTMNWRRSFFRTGSAPTKVDKWAARQGKIGYRL